MTVDATINLAANGGSPDVQAIVGFAQYARYEMLLWQSNHTFIVIGAGDSTQAVQRFSLQLSPGDLKGRRLVWTGELRPLTAPSNQAYAVQLVFFQNGAVVPGVNASKQGNFGTNSRVLETIVCEFA